MNKYLTKKNGIIAAVAVVIVIAAIVFSTSFSQALTLDEAKEIASKYVPSTARFVTSEEEENKYEVMFHDDEAGEGFEVEVHKDTKKVKKVETQLDNDIGSETVTLTESEVKEIVENKFNGVSSVTVSLKKDNGLYVYEADFKSNEFYGDADIHPETGAILESTVKYGTAVTIPTEDQESGTSSSSEGGKFLSYEEVEQLVIEKAGGGFVKDIDLEKERGKYVYEVELIKDNVEYDYIVDAETGEVTLENEHASYFDYDGDYKSGTSGEGSGNGSSNSNSNSSSNSGKDGSSSSTGGSSSSNGSSNSNSNGYGDSSSDRISQEKAESIVLAKIPGATIIKLKLEKDDGRYVYEGEAILGDYEYEFEIDANSGVIIDWEKEWYDEWDD